MGRKKKKSDSNETINETINDNSYIYQLNSEEFKFSKDPQKQEEPTPTPQESTSQQEQVAIPLESVSHQEPSQEQVVTPQESVSHQEPSQEQVATPQESVSHQEPHQEQVAIPQESVSHQEPHQEQVAIPQKKQEPELETLNILFTHISEGKNVDLNRWIQHHLGLGFSHIYILNIGNRLSNNIYYSSDLVTIIKTDKTMSLESVMRQSYNFSHKYMFDWMLYLRYNEFLHLSSNLRSFLRDKVKCDQVMINNRSILNMNSVNSPNNYNNYYFTFLDMSNSYINNDLKNYIS